MWLGVPLIAAVQLVPVSRENPPVTHAYSSDAEVQAVLKRACADCHSHETHWPWYSRIAPVSWLIAHDVEEGRAHLNLSVDDYMGAEDALGAEIRQVVESGEMPPWQYVLAHPEARLSEQDTAKLLAWCALLEAGTSGDAKAGDAGEVTGESAAGTTVSP